VALSGRWSNVRSPCGGAGGGSVACVLLPPPRAAARTYVTNGSVLGGVLLTEVVDAFHGCLSEHESACETQGWVGPLGKNVDLMTLKRFAARCPEIADGGWGLAHLLLHNSTTGLLATRLVVAMTVLLPGGGRERLHVTAPAGTPLPIPDSARDIVASVDVARSLIRDVW
jgi:hypothetical protein